MPHVFELKTGRCILELFLFRIWSLGFSVWAGDSELEV